MRASRFLVVLALAGCATFQAPPPLTGPDIVALARSGWTSEQIIDELRRTRTVLWLQGSDFVRLHEAGVPQAVLDHLQREQIEEARWREQQMWGPGLGIGFGGFGFGFGFGGCRYPGPWGC